MRYANRIASIVKDNKELLDLMNMADAPGIISFSGGFPSPETYPVDDVQESIKQVMTDDPRGALSYGSPVGLIELREYIINKMNKDFNMSLGLDEIMLVAGSQQGLDISGLLFIDPGDVILFETPSYLGALNALNTYEAELVAVPTDNDGLILDELDKAFEKYGDRIKMIYVNPDFQNPTGRSWSVDRRKNFMDYISNKDVAVLEDAAYADLSFGSKKLEPLLHYDKIGQVIYLGTFSKVFCPGVRTGWICGAKSIIDRYMSLKTSVDLSPSPLLQRTISYYLRDHDLDAHVDEICKLYKHRRDVMYEAMLEHFPSDVEFHLPGGGLFFWATLDKNIDTRKLLVDAVEKKVAFVPGGAFYPDALRNNDMRLNFSNMNDSEIKKGIRILGELIASY